MSDTNMLPLPEPAEIMPRSGDYVFHVPPVRAYTAEQMREYAAACVAAERERLQRIYANVLRDTKALLGDGHDGQREGGA